MRRPSTNGATWRRNTTCSVGDRPCVSGPAGADGRRVVTLARRAIPGVAAGRAEPATGAVAVSAGTVRRRLKKFPFCGQAGFYRSIWRPMPARDRWPSIRPSATCRLDRDRRGWNSAPAGAGKDAIDVGLSRWLEEKIDPSDFCDNDTTRSAFDGDPEASSCAFQRKIISARTSCAWSNPIRARRPP